MDILKEELPDILSDLIAKDLLGVLDREEQEELERLCRRYGISEEEREAVVTALEQPVCFDSGGAYRQFAALTRRRRIFRRLRVAAAVLLLLGLGNLVYYYSQLASPQLLVVNQEIVPGESKATITLANGQKVELENLVRELKEADGTLLSSGAGELVYNESGGDGELIYNTIDIPRGGEFRLVLSDGTKVWLNSDSQLRYPVRFNGDMREVFLKGEAYFEVAHNAEKTFVVSTSKGDVRVLGTSFNVRDYPDEHKVVTTLEAGQVRYVSPVRGEIDLIPGYMLEDGAGGSCIPRKVNTEVYTGWKDGKYIFDDVSVEEIMATLERWYDVTVFYENDQVRKLHFTGDLERYSTINTILNFMETGGDVRFRIDGKTIIVGRK